MSVIQSPYHHNSLRLDQENKIVFTSYSKRNFYLRSEISQFVLGQGETPINPFLNFDYNLAGIVDQSLIRVANNTMIERSDELWVFGEVSDGVLVEIYIAKKQSKPVRYFVRESVGRYTEITESQVRLEDVSSWMWGYVMSGQDLARWHPRLRFYKTYPLIYPAYSKRNFYLQMHISQFCLEHHVVPLNPFMLFRYFLGDSVSRETIYRANNNIVRISDGVWTFDDVSDGVLAEIILKKKHGGDVRYHKPSSSNPIRFRRIQPKSVIFETQDGDLEKFRDQL